MKNAWNNLLVAVPKVSGGRTDKNDIWLCVDTCPGNSAVMGPKYNLPKITEMFSQMKGAKFFTELDVMNAFHQIRVSTLAGNIYGFTAPDGHQMCWLQMLFQPTTACSHFQRVIDVVIAGKEGSAVAYVDNVVIFSNDLETHVEDV